MLEPRRDENVAVKKLIDAGSDMAGGAVGAAVGTLFAGPPGAVGGAVGGAAFSHVIRAVAGEFAGRLQGQRERARAGALLALTAAEVLQRLDHSERLRSDDFFDDMPGDRSTAREIAEGVLIAAQRDHEERKLGARYAAMLANLCMADAQSAGIDRPMANLLLSLARSLNYQQLCIIEALHKRGPAVPPDDASQAYIRDLADADGRSGVVVANATQTITMGLVHVPVLWSFKPFFNFLTAELTPLALRLESLMELEQLPQADVERVRELLIAPVTAPKANDM